MATCGATYDGRPAPPRSLRLDEQRRPECAPTRASSPRMGISGDDRDMVVMESVVEVIMVVVGVMVVGMMVEVV